MMYKQPTRPGKPENQHHQGQSLIEFVLVMPIFVLLLVGGTFTAFNFYQAQMASDAVRQTALKKLEMAGSKDMIAAGTLQGYINSGDTKGSMNLGSLVDSVTYADGGPYATFVIGNKQTTGVLGIVPGARIQVSQAVNRNLLLPANAGTAVARPATTPWVPGGAPVPPSWEAAAPAPLPAPAPAI
ncbi:MAG TPA: TadE family protein [Coleofasciculaceae cyanobacterium]